MSNYFASAIRPAGRRGCYATPHFLVFREAVFLFFSPPSPPFPASFLVYLCRPLHLLRASRCAGVLVGPTVLVSASNRKSSSLLSPSPLLSTLYFSLSLLLPQRIRIPSTFCLSNKSGRKRAVGEQRRKCRRDGGREKKEGDWEMLGRWKWNERVTCSREGVRTRTTGQ